MKYKGALFFVLSWTVAVCHLGLRFITFSFFLKETVFFSRYIENMSLTYLYMNMIYNYHYTLDNSTLCNFKALAGQPVRYLCSFSV